jgi:hypothetical protein
MSETRFDLGYRLHGLTETLDRVEATASPQNHYNHWREYTAQDAHVRHDASGRRFRPERHSGRHSRRPMAPGGRPGWANLRRECAMKNLQFSAAPLRHELVPLHRVYELLTVFG